MSSKKAISPIIAIVVILLITIAIAGAGYSYISLYWGSVAGKNIMVTDATCMEDNVVSIMIKNSGSEMVLLSNIRIMETESGKEIENPTWVSMDKSQAVTELAPGRMCKMLTVCESYCKYMVIYEGMTTSPIPVDCTGGKEYSGPVCGNNVIEEGEACDGLNLAGETCESQGIGSGTLACYPSGHASECSFDTSGCEGATPECSDDPQCDDGDSCTTDSCVGGHCSNAPKDCSVLDSACTVGACNPATGDCEAQPVNEGGGCDDGAECTENDVCTSGTCQGTPKTEGTECSAGYCDISGNCVECITTDNCDPGYVCKDNECIPSECSVPGDCPDNVCYEPTCEDGICGETPLAAYQTDAGCEAPLMCDGSGSCVECITTDDCDAGYECQGGQCVKVISACGITLDQPYKTYKLQDNLTTTGTCLTVVADGITIDMAGHGIKGDDSGTDYGINLNGYDGVTIKNGVVSDFRYGIYLRENHGNNISNIGAVSNYHGIYAHSNSDSTIENNILDSNSYGIYMYSCTGNNLSSNNVISNGYGVYFSLDSKNIMTENRMNNNTINFYLYGSSDNNFDHIIDTTNIVDYSYRIYYNKSVSNHDFGSIPDAGIILCTGCNNVSYRNMNVSHNNYYGIFFWNTNNSRAENIISESNTNGVYLRSSSNNLLTNITAASSTYGIYMNYAYGNNITNCTLNSNSMRGVYMYLCSGNTFNNNALSSNRDGFYISSSPNNSITGIKIESSSSNAIYLYASPDNRFEGGHIDYSGGYGIQASGFSASYNSRNNFFKDIILENITGYDVYLKYAENTGFLNASYDISSEYVTTSADLTRQWYYRARVEDGAAGNPIEGATIDADSARSPLGDFVLTTGSGGYTPIHGITEYVNNAGARTYYSNYTITASADGYSDNTDTYNATASQNELEDLFILAPL